MTIERRTRPNRSKAPERGNKGKDPGLMTPGRFVCRRLASSALHLAEGVAPRKVGKTRVTPNTNPPTQPTHQPTQPVSDPAFRRGRAWMSVAQTAELPNDGRELGGLPLPGSFRG